MIKSKFKKIISVVLALMCLLSCVVFTASAKGDEPHQPYPCYCEECIQRFNDKLGSNTFLYNLSGFIDGFNGCYLVIAYNDHKRVYHVCFSDNLPSLYIDTSSNASAYVSVSGSGFLKSFKSDSSYSIDLSSVSKSDFTYYPSYELRVRSTLSYNFPLFGSYGTDYGYFLYLPFTASDIAPLLDSDLNFKNRMILSYFSYPEAPLTDTQIFKSQFPVFLKTAWSSISDFIVLNPIVLLVFAIAALGALIGIVKGTTR